MRKLFTICILGLLPLYMLAGVTTYTFTSKKWASKIDATVCDGTTDGWMCDSAAYNYSSGNKDAQGLPYGIGVSVKKTTSGAGATSVKEFTDIRRITFNFCQNKSSGRGYIYVQIGDNEPDSIQVNKPTDGKGDYTRDSVFNYATPLSGKIKFWVKCTENAININTISIRSASGSSIFTMDTYQLVTDVNQLEDSDQVIFGVFQEGVNYIMGYYDEYESVNNIHAIAGKYAADRNTVESDDRAVYTLRIADLNGEKMFVFQDELRYEEAYLVASGGKTKNRLALWTDVTSSVYGNYGYWDIAISDGGKAVITNQGSSTSKIIQYNASNNPTLFGCYASESQTPVCLYRRVPAPGDVAVILAPFVNFGTTIEPTGKRTIQVNANKLTEDIAVSLKNGSIFSISSEVLDRDGDALTIHYDASAAGPYVDSLILRSGETETRVAINLHRINPMTIAEAVTQEDNTMVYLNEVEVTKKFDTYIYVRDETGSMLLFDRANGATGKRYGADVKAGHPLTGVTGRFINYFGVPEVSPTAQFKIGQQREVLPEEAPESIDSIDVCRYLLLDSAVVNSMADLTYKGKTYAVENKFNVSSFISGVPTKTTVIVSYDHDIVTLYIVDQESYPQGLDAVKSTRQGRLVLRDGVVVVETESGIYSLQGEKIL